MSIDGRVTCPTCGIKFDPFPHVFYRSPEEVRTKCPKCGEILQYIFADGITKERAA